MSTLTIRLSDFAASVLENLVEKTGQSRTYLVIEGLKSLASMIRDDERVTRLSAKEFDVFMDQLVDGEKDPQVLAARKRLMSIKPVWED